MALLFSRKGKLCMLRQYGQGAEMFREMEIISVCGAFERHYEGFMKVAFELDLKGCKAIYGLNIKISCF